MIDPGFAVPLQKLSLSCDVNVHVLRLDTLGHYEGGNKLFKLKYNLAEAKAQGHVKILTFGGAWSNHLAAFAAAHVGAPQVKKIAVVRGERPPTLSDTLRFCQEQGVHLHFVSREEYRKKEEAGFAIGLREKFGNFYLLPEGGSNELAVKGCREILGHIPIDFDYVCCPVGSGATLAGLASGLKPHQKAIGFVALKGASYLEETVRKLMPAEASGSAVTFDHEHHFGGFAKTTPELLTFKRTFEAQQDFEVDYIYSSKMFFGLLHRIKTGYFRSGATVVAVHTGGLQGNPGFTGS